MVSGLRIQWDGGENAPRSWEEGMAYAAEHGWVARGTEGWLSSPMCWSLMSSPAQEQEETCLLGFFRPLQGRMSPLEFAEELKEEANEYNGFNLIVADISAKLMVYVSNRPKGEPVTIQMVSPGLHVLSNAKLDTSWHKAQCLRAGFINLILNYGEEEVIHPIDMIEKLMCDTTKADRESLPNTGCDPDWELNLSSIFVEVKTKLGLYGTRSSAALTVKADGNVSFYEKYLENEVWKEHTVAYDTEKIH
ncbi:hypothetical protein ZIOFF_019367 [Zingiber officinale]|uniref:Uncharacterized protein n=1 Tax=Zingiber officinale TaxID=94328 RepID=A0A8J5H9G5_ZINOF|nr:hypothetical protein ZIOFF_019367 [Zingiber officinale]